MNKYIGDKIRVLVKYLALIVTVFILMIIARKTGISKIIIDFIEFRYVMLTSKDEMNPVVSEKVPIYIQHAGGALGQLTYTNSLEALDANYAVGERYFELDFDITSDNELVCIHGWEQVIAFQDTVAGQVYSLEDFNRLRRKDGLTQLDLARLVRWLSLHPDATIITDVKSDNVKGLSLIARKYPKMINRFIPQIYRLHEYVEVRSLGFTKIILTLYMREYCDSIVLNFALHFHPYAITMWEKRSLKSDLPRKLANQNIIVFAHTVNDLNKVSYLRKIGVYGVYTDYLRINY